MKLKSCFSVVLLFLCATACAPPQGGEEDVSETSERGDEASSFDGVYEFVRLETPEGENTDQQGLMIVHEDYVCHVRASKERQAIVQDDSEQVRQEKAAALFLASAAACGQYTLEGDTLTVDWETASDPSVERNETEFILTQSEGELLLAPASAPEFKFVYRPVQ